MHPTRKHFHHENNKIKKAYSAYQWFNTTASNQNIILIGHTMKTTRQKVKHEVESK